MKTFSIITDVLFTFWVLVELFLTLKNIRFIKDVDGETSKYSFEYDSETKFDKYRYLKIPMFILATIVFVLLIIKFILF